MGSEARASASARASNGSARRTNKTKKNTMTSGTALKRIGGTVFHGLTCVADEGIVDRSKKRKGKENAKRDENKRRRTKHIRKT